MTKSFREKYPNTEVKQLVDIIKLIQDSLTIELSCYKDSLANGGYENDVKATLLFDGVEISSSSITITHME